MDNKKSLILNNLASSYTTRNFIRDNPFMRCTQIPLGNINEVILDKNKQ